MTNVPEPTTDSTAIDHRPRTLSRKQLTIALIGVTLIPVICVLVLYFFTAAIPDPHLPVQVSIAPRAWPNDADPNARIVPSLVVTNPTQDEWDHLSLSINDQFHFDHPHIVPGQEDVVIPLKFFHTKGNQFYPPEAQPLKELTVYAQIPSKARAIAEFKGTDIPGYRPPVLENSSAEAK